MRKLKTTELNRLSTAAFKETDKIPVVVVLDNIRSAMNIGSVFRTSDAFLLEKIILVGISATPPNRDIQKAALGATETVNWTYISTIEEAINGLKSEGHLIYAVEQSDTSVLLDELNIDEKTGKYALVFGNEVDGVSQYVMDHCDTCIEIPQFGMKHSLNVSVAVGIVVWEFARKLHP
jgi:23S rRNA (guanosine2251-2'-O)-methyltransferase